MRFKFFVTILSALTTLLLPSVVAVPGLIPALGDGGLIPLPGLKHMPIPLPAVLVPEFYPLVRLPLSLRYRVLTQPMLPPQLFPLASKIGTVVHPQLVALLGVKLLEDLDTLVDSLCM